MGIGDVDKELDSELEDDLATATEVEKPTPFAESVAKTLTKALVSLRERGMIEVEDGKLELLTNEVIVTVLESSSARKLPLRIVKTLIHSEHLEEVYGSDVELSAALQPFLEEI